MADQTDQSAGVALDGFVAYYTEKLWDWVPGFYRTEDAYTPTPGALRRIIEEMGRDAATLRRRIDRLWENNFVELADDEALVKLGELLATRMVHALNRRGRRVDVARTIFYRRRKGTPRVLESLITDITGWEGLHLDTRLRLARTQHLLEPPPPVGMFSKTPRGGWANVRSPRLPELAFTGFEELAHTPDFRRYDGGSRGVYGIEKTNVHAYRMRALELSRPTLHQLGANSGKFTFDPSGRDVPLFQPANRPTADLWTRPREWQMPKALDCRLIGHAEFEWTATMIDELVPPLLLASGNRLKKYAGYRIPSELELRRLIDSLVEAADINTNLAALMAATMVSECGLAQLYGSALGVAVGADNSASQLAASAVTFGNLSAWGQTFASLKQVIVDPERGRARIDTAVNPGELVIAHLMHYGSPGEIGAGSYDRRFDIETVGVNALPNGGNAAGPIGLTLPSDPTAIDEVVDSKTYNPSSADPSGNLLDLEDYRLQARNFQRPYLLRSTETLEWVFEAANKVTSEDVRCLVLEGLWIGIEDPTQAAQAGSYTPVPATLAIEGVWDRVVIRHCTLDPGGHKAVVTPGQFVPIPYVKLEIRDFVEELVIESSITGPIVEAAAGNSPATVGKIIIRDSIVRGQTGVKAIDTQLGQVELERSTVLGDIEVNRLYASDSLIFGTGTITDLQHGCFRFSAAVDGKWPHPFESHRYPSMSPAWLVSDRFGDPGFGQLSEVAPAEIRRGAENYAEMGAFNQLLDPIKRDDLRAKIDEFMPFDLVDQLDIEN